MVVRMVLRILADKGCDIAFAVLVLPTARRVEGQYGAIAPYPGTETCVVKILKFFTARGKTTLLPKRPQVDANLRPLAEKVNAAFSIKGST